MAYDQYSYISSLNTLSNGNSPELSGPTEEELADELALWSNAQFTFDIEPGVGIYEDKRLEYEPAIESSKSLSDLAQAKEDLDPVTYEGLANYLDYELPQQRSLTQPAIRPAIQPQQPLIQSRPVANSKPAMPILAPRIAPAPPTDGSASFNAGNFTANFGVPMIYPKPSGTTEPKATTAGVKRKAIDSASPDTVSVSTDSNSDAKTAGEEDKRRRNTAASARFRIKKKQREQALEQTAKEMTEKAEQLEGRVKELEMEIKWLRSILIEKESSRSSDGGASSEVTKLETKPKGIKSL